MASQVLIHDVYALERRVQAGNAFYVRIGRDLAGRSLRFDIIGDPDTMRVVRTLTFQKVQDFEELWFQRGGDKAEYTSMLFLTQHPQGSGFLYNILLGGSEMCFYSEAEPEVTGTAASN